MSRWTIRARVTNKSGIRTWSNARGEGKLFSMEMVDESVSDRFAAKLAYLSRRSGVNLSGIQVSLAPGPGKIPTFIPGRDPRHRVQPGGGQVLQPYRSWQGEPFLQTTIPRA